MFFPSLKFLSFLEIPYSGIRNQFVRTKFVLRERTTTSGRPNSALKGNILLTFNTTKLDFTDVVLSEGNQHKTGKTIPNDHHAMSKVTDGDRNQNRGSLRSELDCERVAGGSLGWSKC